MQNLKRMATSGLVFLALAGCKDNSERHITEVFPSSRDTSTRLTIDDWIADRSDYVVFSKSVGNEEGTDCGFCEQAKPVFEKLAKQYTRNVTPEVEDIKFSWINVADSLKNLDKVPSGIFPDEKGVPYFGVAKRLSDGTYVIDAGPWDSKDLRGNLADYFKNKGFTEATKLEFDSEVPSAHPDYWRTPQNFQINDIVLDDNYVITPEETSVSINSITLPPQYSRYFNGTNHFSIIFNTLEPLNEKLKNQIDAMLYINLGSKDLEQRGISVEQLQESLRRGLLIPQGLVPRLYVHPGVDSWINESESPKVREDRINKLFQGRLPLKLYQERFVPDYSTPEGLNKIQGIAEGNVTRLAQD